ncbi:MULTISPECIES: endonuclease III [unclassified Pseudodesulfovibrio]|uniref:endonuclease III n=1 Tax=unclassified Pseudodesulfovibrio TaxID=2661612 RepID=UPI000FEB9970|nr:MULTISPECIES: endonuclease III [unclassified Pseudodesulfovibrio]MCJ2163981.1 endonuclease III [Pseudodesulfovibrio sp. S3-i]RWU05379.1 endonuclease III [Pseudodesulfovibrio sp. S3]
MKKKERATEILNRLSNRYPSPRAALTWSTPWELLVATALSAQCTDERVNMVTPAFFERWPDIRDAAEADVMEIEEVVRSTGFFRNKARNIKAAATRIMNEYGGEVPKTMAELITLGGVARKTASIVLSNAFGVNEGIAVDTHVKRLAFRLGLTDKTDPIRIEKELMPLFPRPQWGNINHYLVFFGREVCPARKPKCGICELDDICPKKGVDQ